MRGLIIKDLYMMAKYCRSYLIITVVFCLASFFGKDNSFFSVYPSILCGMIPVNLLAYDERSRWTQYSRTMPYTVGQIVSGKYIVGLMAQTAVLVIMGVLQTVRMNIDGAFSWGGLLSFVAILISLSLTASALCLPFIFWLGVEKGRIAYYVVVGVATALAVFFTNWETNAEVASINIDGVIPVVCIVSVAVYALSWIISVFAYRSRAL